MKRIIFAASLLLAGCVTDQAVTGIDPNAQIIAAQSAGRQVGYIGPGDTKEYVRSQWGYPANVRQTITAGRNFEFWDYECTGPRLGTGQWLGCAYRVTFADGLVYAVSQ
jgi:hypothetical protein